MKTWWHGEDKQFTLRLQSQLQGIQSLSYSNFKWILTYKSIEPPCGTLETNIILEINYATIEKKKKITKGVNDGSWFQTQKSVSRATQFMGPQSWMLRMPRNEHQPGKVQEQWEEQGALAQSQGVRGAFLKGGSLSWDWRGIGGNQRGWGGKDTGSREKTNYDRRKQGYFLRKQQALLAGVWGLDFADQAKGSGLSLKFKENTIVRFAFRERPCYFNMENRLEEARMPTRRLGTHIWPGIWGRRWSMTLEGQQGYKEQFSLLAIPLSLSVRALPR